MSNKWDNVQPADHYAKINSFGLIQDASALHLGPDFLFILQ